jgi:hypothetical protein
MKKVVAIANPFVLSVFMAEGIDTYAVMIHSSISEVVVAVYILPFPISDFIQIYTRINSDNLYCC